MDPLIKSGQDGKVAERMKEGEQECKRQAADESRGRAIRKQ